MRSVLIGSEYPVTGTPHFLFPILYRNLCRGVAQCYASSCFQQNIPLGDFPAIRHLKHADLVVVDCHPLIGYTVLLDRRIYLDVVYQFGYHALGNYCDMGVPPYHLQKVLHIHPLPLDLF